MAGILLNESNREDLWCGAYLLKGGCGEDQFEYFQCWLIMQGRDHFYATLENVDYLLEVIKPVKPKDDTTLEFENLLGAADYAMESRVGRADENFESISELYPGDSPERKEIELSWSEEDEDSMKRLCPGLLERFGERAFLL